MTRGNCIVHKNNQVAPQLGCKIWPTRGSGQKKHGWLVGWGTNRESRDSPKFGRRDGFLTELEGDFSPTGWEQEKGREGRCMAGWIDGWQGGAV